MHLSEAVEILRKKAAIAAKRGHLHTAKQISLAVEILDVQVAGDPSDGHTNGQPSTGGA